MYTYAFSRPLVLTDPTGLSAADVELLEQFFREYVFTLTEEGKRIDPGWVNNLVGVACLGQSALLGCKDQATILRDKLDNIYLYRGMDDDWFFEVESQSLLSMDYHFFVVAKSGNICDPDLKLDPWNNLFERRPKQ